MCTYKDEREKGTTGSRERERDESVVDLSRSRHGIYFGGGEGGRKEKERRGKRESVRCGRGKIRSAMQVRVRERWFAAHAGRRTTTAGIDCDAQVGGTEALTHPGTQQRLRDRE